MFELCVTWKGSYDEFVQHHDMSKWRVERKFDGERIMLFFKGGKAKLINRRGIDKTFHFNEAAQEWQKHLSMNSDGSIVLDGEIISENFNAIQRRSKANDKVIKHLKELYPVQFVPFDILFWNGEDMRNKPLKERCEFLKPEALNWKTAWKQVEKNNWEGVVVKRLNSKYEARRSPNWVKIKKWKEEIVKVIRHEEGKGYGTFIVFRKGKQERVNCPGKKWLDTWESDKSGMLKVRYLEETESGKLRFPVPVEWVYKSEAK